ncbi:polysaccharide deacetylase family protein [Herbidospora cretacea]|uniref:polysaccharide deacetylase family protein n=1 Tax=Herbidospora cretacea TaxID=28444 RepID=UPI0009DD3762|nr:polysaccharide deacetylase family protein [Herbidospora cretacea]
MRAFLRLLAVTVCVMVNTPPVHAETPDPDLLNRKLTLAQPDFPRLPFPPVRRVDCTKAKCVALTFDDGPGAETGKVLNHLARHQAKATFYVLGKLVTPESAPVLKRMVAEGHELGNHSWDHAMLSGLSRDGVDRQLSRTQQVVRKITGVRMRTMRPPYGATSKMVGEVSKLHGLAQIIWSVDTQDWLVRKPDRIVRRSASAKPGEVILLHDIHESTVRSVPRLLDALDKKGFVYVTISELFGEMAPGKKYFDNRGK